MFTLNHPIVDVAIICSDFEKSLHFYRDMLGLTPVLDIEELEIRAPLLLDGPNGRTMRLTLDPDDGRLAIHSREPATGSEWQLNAVARQGPRPHFSPGAPESIKISVPAKN